MSGWSDEGTQETMGNVTDGFKELQVDLEVRVFNSEL